MQARQGDIFFVSIDKSDLPDDLIEALPRNGQLIIAEGEATGHNHILVGEGARILLHEQTDTMYLEIVGKAHAMHEEHGEIEFKKGYVEVVPQREYVDPTPQRAASTRRVWD